MSLLVFKILKPSKSFHGIAYNERKTKNGNARLLHFSNFGILTDGGTAPSAKDAKKYLEAYSNTNTRMRHKQFHAILSCKGKSIPLERLKDFGVEILDKLGYGMNPIMVYGHNDTANRHVHLITTRVGPDGNKIAHHFENKRANKILSEITGIDRQKEVQTAIASALSYQFGTVAQFKLLLEQQGYSVQEKKEALELFKYGSLQATISLSSVHFRMQSYQPAPPAISRIRALIYKYKNQYSTTPLDSIRPYQQKAGGLQTELTDKLHALFGLQFCFFTGKGHTAPYGYILIDHTNKTCYKGADIFPVAALLQSIKQDGPIHAPTLGNKTVPAPTDPLIPQPPYPIEQSTHQHFDWSISYIVDELIRESGQDAEQEIRCNSPKKKSSRRRFT